MQASVGQRNARSLGDDMQDRAESEAEEVEDSVRHDSDQITSTHDFQTHQDSTLRVVTASYPEVNGMSTPPGRRSIQFARDTDTEEQRPTLNVVETPVTPGNDSALRRREKFAQRMRSFGLPSKPSGHLRTRSAITVPAGDGLAESPIVHPDAGDTTEGEMGDSSVPPSPGPSTFGKRRRKVAPDWFSPTIEPNTPLGGSFQNRRNPQSPSPARKLRPRPRRRATMTDVPEGSREGMSEDEARARLAQSPKWKRRSSAWQPTNFRHRRPSRQEESAEKSKSSNFRRLRRSATATDVEDGGGATKGEAVRRFRNGINKINVALRLGPKRKEKTQDIMKSAELMAELLAGSPAAIIFASHFQPDELHKKKVPVLLEQLKIRITDTDKPKDSNRHPRFRIELEYGNGLMRMQWVIWRSLRNFVELHGKYTGSQLADWRRQRMKSGHQGLPHFPRSAFPALKDVVGPGGMREEDEDLGDQSGTAVEARSQTPQRPGVSKHRHGSSHHGRSHSSGGLRGFGGPLSRTNTGQEGEAAKEDFNDRQRRKLENYLREMIRYFMFRGGSNRLCRFLEVSALGVNLAAEGGYHGKEGKLTIKETNKLKVATSWKWFLVRESYIAWVESPEETVLLDVFMVDPDFELQARRPRVRDQASAKEMAKTAKANKGRTSKHRLKLNNSERKLELLSKSERQQQQFALSITTMIESTIWSKQHRFNSFAPLRQNVHAEWLVDARDYMWKISRAIDMAENVIYIHDWWLSPELYLRRPPGISHKWRLDRLLQRKARQGVKIFIIMYRNINSAIPIDSEYSKQALLDLHPNIYVQRSPNQVRQQVFFWAHHEKICVVDHLIAFCGGVDLCFGRWDTPDHRVVDDKKTGREGASYHRDEETSQLWPGKDYSNPRVQDFYNLFEPYGEMYDRNKTPRMPWHDIGMQMVGQPARDLSRHFIQRWNYLLRQRKALGRGGLSRPVPVLLPPPEFNPDDLRSVGFAGTCDVQMLRSCGEWSIGTPDKTERSIQNAYIKLIEASDHFVYIENQFFISSCWVESAQITNQIGDALVERITRAHRNGEDWAAVIVIPLMPGFQNLVDEQDGTSVRLIMECQFRSICRGEKSIFGRLKAEGIDPTEYIQFYSLRQWGKIGSEKALTTEQLYIHAKCMIVDDRTVIIGSANINERSMCGDRDSEVAACVRDNDMVDSTMAGRPYKVGRFAHSLRVRLMREHLGIDVDCIRNEEVETWATLQAHVDREHVKSHDDLVKQNLDEFAGPTSPTAEYFPFMKEPSRSDAQPENFGSNESTHIDPARDSGRDTVILEGGREVLVGTEYPEGKGTRSLPSRSTLSYCDRSKVLGHHQQPSSEQVALPPPMPPRMHTQELGLTQLSQLPPLPVTDDSDIGGPPIKTLARISTSSLSAFVSEISRPVIEDDSMKDPLSDAFLQDIWHKVAENNTKIYRQVFRCMPDNEVVNWEQYKAFNQYNARFNESQGIGQTRTRSAHGPSKTGPPGTGAEQMARQDSVTLTGSVTEKQRPVSARDISVATTPTLPLSEKSRSETTRDRSTTATSTQPPSILRLHTANSTRSNTGSDGQDEPLNEKSSTVADDDKREIEFGSLPSKEGVGAIDEKSSNGNSQIDGSASTRRRRRATTKGSAMLRNTDPVINKDDAEELLKLIQGTLVVFPYDWLSKETWLYAIDTVAPLEIYD